MKLKEEKTLVLIKPDGVKRGLAGVIIQEIEKRGLKIVGMQMVWSTKEQMIRHYSDSEANLRAMGGKTLATYKDYSLDPVAELGTDDSMKIGKMVHGWIVDFMSSGPIIKMVVQGIHSVEMVRKIVGGTLPFKADVGTIRGSYSVDSPILANSQKRGVRNIVHASGSISEAEQEIALWFDKSEINEYNRAEEDIMF